jgi:hypothetical protein
MSKIEFTEQGYEKEMEILRKKIDTIDEKIIKFIIAISQKIKGTLSRGIIKISIQTSDGNKKKVQYTLNSFDEDKQFFRE